MQGRTFGGEVDTSPVVTTLNVTANEQARIDKWLKEEVYPPLVAKQKAAYAEKGNSPSVIEQQDWEAGYPYGGAIGGGLTYEFTPTSIGLIFKVRYSGHEEPLDLTDYASW